MNAELIQEVADGIYQIRGRQGAAHIYIVKGSRRTVMIDSGLSQTFAITQSALAELGMTPGDIDLVLLTHDHIDHAGGAPLMPTSCVVAAHRMSAEKLALKDEFAQYNQVFAAGFAHVQVDVCLEHGSIIDTGSHQLEVIYTPGHCSGAICLYEHRTRAMFTADVIMANGVVGGVVASGNISDFIGSLRRLRPWHIDLLLPGHGATSTEALRCIDIGIARLETLLRETRDIFSAMTGADHGYASIMRSLRGLNAASHPDADAG